MKRYLLSLLAVGALFSCSPGGKSIAQLETKAFDTTLNGKAVSLYTLKNQAGMTAQITNYGARVVSLWVPDKDGKMQDVVWGYPSIAAYLEASDTYAGPVVGRYGNRIAASKFTLDTVEYTVTPNEGPNQLHGGPKGFSNQVWEALQSDSTSVTMSYLSPDGEEGYPGNLTLTVTYTMTGKGLEIDYSATTDAPTVVNPTSHVYFNLHGAANHSINSHVMQLFADRFTPTDAALIPTGEIAPVEGTPMDFRTPTAIGDRVDQTDYEPLKFGGGYDHNYVLNKAAGDPFQLAATVYEPATGIVMNVYTDQPGVQFYGGNAMDGKDDGKYDAKHLYRTGFALETQNYPDAPNHPHFPSSVLRPGETYTQKTLYEFQVKSN